jgi:hypothetical protein
LHATFQNYRAMIAEQLANLPVGGDGSNQHKTANITGVRIAQVTQAEAANQLGTTPKAITQARVWQARVCAASRITAAVARQSRPGCISGREPQAL